MLFSFDNGIRFHTARKKKLMPMFFHHQHPFLPSDFLSLTGLLKIGVGHKKKQDDHVSSTQLCIFNIGSRYWARSTFILELQTSKRC